MDTFSETAVVAVLGMGVVFLSLAVLSALMYATQVLSRRPARSSRQQASAAVTDRGRWLAAAVVAYLAAEEDAGAHAVTAVPWRGAAPASRAQL